MKKIENINLLHWFYLSTSEAMSFILTASLCIAFYYADICIYIFIVNIQMVLDGCQQKKSKTILLCIQIHKK